MNLKDLMLNDWCFFNDTPHRVREVVFGSNDIPEVKVDGPDFHLFCHEISPIPLTEEVLKANGWEEFYRGGKCVTQRYFERGGDRRLELSLISGDKCFCTCLGLGRLDFFYVHELQHIIRLCGLNELADNFKVE